MNWFRTIIAQYEGRIEQLSKQNPYPFKDWFDENGRAYFPFVPGGGQEGVDEDVRAELEGNGFQIIDYRKGYCQSGNRQLRIGKVLNSLRQKALTQIQTQAQIIEQEPDPIKKQIFSNQLQKEIESTNKYYDGLMDTFINSSYRAQQKAAEFYVVVSQNPYDVAYMSTGRQWTSCMELGEGQHYEDVFCEVAGGGLVAYLIRADDKDISDPLARIHIRRFDNREGSRSVAVPEQSVYGNEIKGFQEAVQQWLNGKQGIVTPGVYARQGGEYSDTFGNSFLAAPTEQQDVLSWLRGEGVDAVYSTWTVEDLLYEDWKLQDYQTDMWGGDYYDPPDQVDNESRTFKTEEEAKAYLAQKTQEDEQFGEYAREAFAEMDQETQWIEKDEETGEWVEERFWLKENKTDNRSDMRNEAMKIIISAPKGTYPVEVLQEVKKMLFGGDYIYSPRQKDLINAYPELFTDEEIKEMKDTDSLSLFSKLPPERQEEQRKQWGNYIVDVLENPQMLVNVKVQEEMKNRDRATDVNTKVRAEDSVGLHYSLAVTDWLLEPIRQIYKPIPEPVIQQLVGFAQNFLQGDSPVTPYGPGQIAERYNNQILTRIAGALAHTGSDTPTVQRFYKQLLPLWEDNRENYYDDYSRINVNTLGQDIARLGENGRDFLPFIDKKIEEESAAVAQLEGGIAEEQKGRRPTQDLLQRAYGKVAKLYYIKDAIESGTGRSDKYKWSHKKGNWFKKAQGASELFNDLLGLRPKLANSAQQLYNEWDQDEDGYDEQFGSGGICDEIANVLAETIFANLDYVEVVPAGQDGDDHAWVFVHDGNEVYEVDIPPQVYETGGGYMWRKIPNVIFQPEDVHIGKVDINPNDLS